MKKISVLFLLFLSILFLQGMSSGLAVANDPTRISVGARVLGMGNLCRRRRRYRFDLHKPGRPHFAQHSAGHLDGR